MLSGLLCKDLFRGISALIIYDFWTSGLFNEAELISYILFKRSRTYDNLELLKDRCLFLSLFLYFILFYSLDFILIFISNYLIGHNLFPLL